MDTVPTPVINENIVQAAMIALAYFKPTSAEEAASMLLFWVRRAEMTDADVAEVGERMFLRPVELMPCPAWCETEHERYSYNEFEDLCEHDRDLLVEHDEKGSVKVQVYLVQADEPLTPGQAIRMVGAVSEGLRIISQAV
jgi:hypothetical protein